MSISVRLWSKEELKAAKTNRWLATLLMNAPTLLKGLLEEELEAYPYEKRRTYICAWADSPELITVYATDQRMLKKLLESEYTRLPDRIDQLITQYKPVSL